MATLTITNSFVAGTEALASEVNQNFTDVRTFVNTQTIHKDGGNLPFTVTPTISSTSANAVSLANHLTNKAYVDAEKTDLLDNGKPKNVAWGRVAATSKTTDQTITSTSFVDVASVSFTAVANRRYRLLVHFTALSNNGNVFRTYAILTDSANTQISEWMHSFSFNDQSTSGSILHYVTPSAGSTTYKVRARTTGGGSWDVRAGSAFPMWLSVEDVGPV